jgi:phage terminase large subunit-like protein
VQHVAGDARLATLKPFTLPHFRAWARDLTLDTGEPWALEWFQAAFIRDLFGLNRPENWWILPEGNAKTTGAAGLALYVAEFKPRSTIPVAASSREQAEILYRQAESFVLSSPALHEVVHSSIQERKGKAKVKVPRYVCLEGYRRINHANGSRIQVFAADDRTGDGPIPDFAIIDELHRHRDLSLYRTWSGKLDKKPGARLLTISTAGEPGSEFEQTRERIRQSGESSHPRRAMTRVVSSRVLLHEWAVPEDADVEDVRIVKRANPLRAITHASLRAKLGSPTMTLAHWRRMNCNLPTRGEDAAITEDEWNAARSTEAIPEGEPVWVGLDVAWKWDTTAAVPFWMPERDRRILGPATVLTPPRDGSSLDPRIVEDALLDVNDRNPIHTVVMDPTRAEQLAMWIADEIGATVVERAQTASLGVRDFERFMEALRSGWLFHSGDAALTRHALNAVAHVDRFGAARFERASTSRSLQDLRVIDALIAAAMVHAEAVVEPPPASVYEDRDPIFLGG